MCFKKFKCRVDKDADGRITEEEVREVWPYKIAPYYYYYYYFGEIPKMGKYKSRLIYIYTCNQ